MLFQVGQLEQVVVLAAAHKKQRLALVLPIERVLRVGLQSPYRRFRTGARPKQQHDGNTDDRDLSERVHQMILNSETVQPKNRRRWQSPSFV